MADPIRVPHPSRFCLGGVVQGGVVQGGVVQGCSIRNNQDVRSDPGAPSEPPLLGWGRSDVPSRLDSLIAHLLIAVVQGAAQTEVQPSGRIQGWSRAQDEG